MLGTYMLVWGQDPRRYSNIVSLRIADFQKVPTILGDLRAFLTSHPGIDKSLPHDANLAGMSNSTINIGITVRLPICIRRKRARLCELCVGSWSELTLDFSTNRFGEPKALMQPARSAVTVMHVPMPCMRPHLDLQPG